MKDTERVNYCVLGERLCDYHANMGLNVCVVCRTQIILEAINAAAKKRQRNEGV